MNVRHLRSEQLAGRRWRGLVRESTEAQADTWSPERQRGDLRRAAGELGLVPAEPLFYERVGSGEAEGAGELAQALADGKAGGYDVLVVLATSRFARNRAEAVRMKAEFRKAGIVIYFVAQRIISGAYSSGLTEGIHEVIDEQENETRRFWIAGGQRQRQLSGRWLGVVPFGYRKVMADRPDGSRGWDGALESDPDTAPIVRSMFDQAVTLSCRRIALDLNASGSRTSAGRPWSAQAIGYVLGNPAYAGRLVRYRTALARHYYDHDSPDGHQTVADAVPALIDPTLFDQVGEARRARSPSTPHDQRTYPLSRVLRCARCGARMTGVHGGNGTRYYRCRTRTVLGSCDAPGIRAERAEASFARWLGSYALPKDWREAIARSRAEASVTGEKDRRAALEDRLRRLRDLYSWGDISDTDYRRQAADLKEQMGGMVNAPISSLEAVADALRNLGPAWAAAPAELQATVAPLILKAAEVDDGKIAWVVRAELRPLLEVCVPEPGKLYPPAPRYTNSLPYSVRFSA